MSMNEHEGIRTSSAGNTLKWSAALLAALLPALLTFLFLRFDLQVSLADFYPVQWLDQSDYWHEAFTFKEVGFAGGYYGVNEEVTPLPGLRFGTHGPLYPVLYGGLARLTGWDFTTPVYINMALLAAGVLGFVLLAKPRPHQTLLLALLMGVYAPVLYYVPTVLQENMQQAAALVLAGMFADLFLRGGRVSPLRKAVYFLFLFVFAVARFSWGVLFLPWLCLAFPHLGEGKKYWLRGLIYAGISVMLVALVFWISWLVTAPGADTIVMTVKTLRASPSDGVRLILTWLAGNLALLLNPESSVAVALRIQTLGLMFYAGALAWKASRPVPRFEEQEARLALFHLVNLLPLSLALLTVYFLSTDVRVLGPHLLLSLALMIRFSNPRLVMALLAVSLLAYPAFLKEYGQLRPAFTYDRERLEQTRAKLDSKMYYRPEASDPWCNTLLISGMYYYETLLSVPPGVGVTFIWPGSTKEMAMPLKSAWLILDDEKFERLRRTGEFKYKPLTTLPSTGTLYRNTLSSCPLP